MVYFLLFPFLLTSLTINFHINFFQKLAPFPDFLVEVEGHLIYGLLVSHRMLPPFRK
jgi:hypothetical protein